MSAQVLGAGTLQSILSVVVVVAVVLRHRMAPALAVVVGFGSALGVTASHLLPKWSAFSDAFPGSDVALISWIAVLIEVGASLLLGAAGAVALQSTRRTAASPASH